MKQRFNQDTADAYFKLLSEMTNPPPSEAILDGSIVEMIGAYLTSPEEKNPVSVWNFYKHVLDLVVRGSLASEFIATLFNLEVFYEAPEGALAQSSGTMTQAPWRNA